MQTCLRTSHHYNSKASSIHSRQRLQRRYLCWSGLVSKTPRLLSTQLHSSLPWPASFLGGERIWSASCSVVHYPRHACLSFTTNCAYFCSSHFFAASCHCCSVLIFCTHFVMRLDNGQCGHPQLSWGART